MLNPLQVTELMLAHQSGSQAHQLAQTEYRFQIAQAMKLAPGSRILEIGCGQGDMTAVLANQVGPCGKVVAVDPADPSYGAPYNLGQSTTHLKNSVLGERIEFHLNQDPLEPEFLSQKAPFDAAILAHCIWYFPNRDLIYQTLAELRLHISQLFIAEWLLNEQTPAQHMHFLAATLQGKIAPLIPNCDANIQTPLTQAELLDIIQSAGWIIQTQSNLDTSLLPDAQWEIDSALAILSESREPLPIDTESPNSWFAPLHNPELKPSAQPLPAIIVSATA